MIYKNDKTGQFAGELPEVHGPISAPTGYVSTFIVPVEVKTWKLSQDGWRIATQEEYEKHLADADAQARANQAASEQAQIDAVQAQVSVDVAFNERVASVVATLLNTREEFAEKPITREQITIAAMAAAIEVKPK